MKKYEIHEFIRKFEFINDEKIIFHKWKKKPIRLKNMSSTLGSS